MNNVNQQNVNQQQFSAQDFPKSGFDLSYKKYNSYMLGRLHVSGYQHTMPADKINGTNSGSFTFKRLVSPTLSDVEVCQHNFYLPYRAIDTTFEDAFAPGKMNNMSASWTTPSITIQGLATATLNALLGTRWQSSTIWTTLSGVDDGAIGATNLGNLQQLFEPVLTHGAADGIESTSLYTRSIQLYMSDYLTTDFLDYVQKANATLSASTSARDAVRTLFQAVLTPFIGKLSLLNELGYSYVRSYDWITLFEDFNSMTAYTDFIAALDDIPMCEYALRAYYAVWYEHYRSQVLEPVSTNLPNWKKFGSVSVIEPMFLLPRMRSWQQDIFVDASPDDICRHVYAPILGTSLSNPLREIDSYDSSENYLYAELNDPATKQRNAYAVNLDYLNPVTGARQTIYCPVPALVNDYIANGDHGSAISNPYTLDLFNLKKASMLERYLKRNFAFGDEYKQRMLAHYGSNVSDERVNRPQYLSGSVDQIQLKEEIAPVNTPTSNVGDRTITATANSSSDGFTWFCEEFGIVLHIISFMPKAQYAGVCPQNLLARQIDFPLPEFAANNEECGRILEIATNGLIKTDEKTRGLFAHYPYAHAWRTRVDEVGGDFLDELQDTTFRRFFGMDNAGESVPKLNSTFIHCRPNLSMFADTVMYDTQVYGFVYHDCRVERVLPTPVESI